MAGSPTALPGSGISVPRNGVGTGPSLGAGVQSGQHWKLCALLSGRAGSGLEAAGSLRCSGHGFQSTVPISKAMQNY